MLVMITLNYDCRSRKCNRYFISESENNTQADESGDYKSGNKSYDKVMRAVKKFKSGRCDSPVNAIVN